MKIPYLNALKLTYFDALKVKTQEEADDILKALVARAMTEKPELNLDEALAIQRSNIGYATGDLPNTPEGRVQRRLVLGLYDTEHPIFGRYEREYSQEEMLQAGMIVAQVMDETGDIHAAIKAARESL